MSRSENRHYERFSPQMEESGSYDFTPRGQDERLDRERRERMRKIKYRQLVERRDPLEPAAKLEESSHEK